MTSPDPRPRDALGRPLPRGDRGADHGIDVDAERSGDQAIDAAQGLLDNGFPFAAHEVLEARWKSCPDNERSLWQGLAQACVALTHLGRDNRAGALALLDRSRMTLSTAYAAAGDYDVDLESLDNWIDATERTARGSAAAPSLRLRDRGAIG